MVACVYVAQCGMFCAHPRHSNAAEWRRTKLKASRWHPLPLRKLSRGTMTRFLAMSFWLCPWHTLLPPINPVAFGFQQAPLLLGFFHSLSSCNNASLKASWGSGLQFMNVKLFKGHKSACSSCQQLALQEGWRKVFGSVPGYNSQHCRIIQ